MWTASLANNVDKMTNVLAGKTDQLVPNPWSMFFMTGLSILGTVFKAVMKQASANLPKGTYVDLYVAKTIVSTDYGRTWQVSDDNFGPCLNNAANSSLSRISVAFSGDSNYGIATKSNGSLYFTENAGKNWYPQFVPGQQYWSATATSSDGSKLYAAYSSPNGFGVYKSENNAMSWEKLDYFDKESFREGFNIADIATSSNGMCLAVVDCGGQIYLSKDFGNTFSVTNSPQTVRPWNSVTISSSGNTIVASAPTSYVYVSVNGGLTWDFHETLGTQLWTSVAIPDSGEYAIASAYGGGLYKAPITAPPIHPNASGWGGNASRIDVMTSSKPEQHLFSNTSFLFSSILSSILLLVLYLLLPIRGKVLTGGSLHDYDEIPSLDANEGQQTTDIEVL